VSSSRQLLHGTENAIASEGDSLQQRFANERPAPPHFDYLDGWRGIAISFLLLGHFFPVRGIDLGVFGVDLFFVLSGVLMTRILFIQKMPIRTFYKRRVSRIFPVFYLYLITLAAVTLVSHREVIWSEVAAAAFFLNNYFTDIGHEKMPYGHIWSLSVEEHSYVLLSLIALASMRRNKDSLLLIGSLCTFSVAIGLYYWLVPNSGSSKYTEVAAFGIFISAFFTMLLRKTAIPQLPLLVYPALLLVALALQWWSVPRPVQHYAGVALLALTVAILGNAPERLKSALSFAPLRQLGIWSFSIYVWQQPFFLMVERQGSLPGWSGALASLIVGAFSYHLFEMPIRTYLNRTWARNSQLRQ